MVPINRSLSDFFTRISGGDVKLAHNVTRELKINTGISWAILLSIITAIFAGGRAYERLLKNQEQMQSKINNQQNYIEADQIWKQQHQIWASAQSAKIDAEMDEIQRKLKIVPRRVH